MTTPTAYSTFSGIGGMDLGLERAGFHVAGQCELDEYRRAVLAAHFTAEHIAADIREVAEGARPGGLRAVGGDGSRGDADAARPGPPGEHGGGGGVRLAADGLERPGVDHESGGLRTALEGPDGRRHDLVCGGFPCQDLSVAGKRRGLDGDRSGLFFEFIRVADLLVRPGGWVLIENVPGLLSSPPHAPGRDFAVVLASLADIGFHDLAWRVLDSRYFGVPQRRRRVYIVARRARGDRARQVLLEPESGGGNPAPSAAPRPDSASTLGSGSASRRFNYDGDYAVTDALQAGRPGGHRVGADEAAGGQLVAGGGGIGPEETHYYIEDHEDGTLRGDPGRYDRQPIIAAPLTSGGNHESRPGRRMEDDVNIVAFEARVARNGRGVPSDVVPPLKAQSGETGRGDAAPMVAFTQNQRDELRDLGDTAAQLLSQAGSKMETRIAADARVRRLTPTECERLQAFPDGWTQLGDTPDGKRYHALGDAVTVNVAEWIGRRLLRYGELDGPSPPSPAG